MECKWRSDLRYINSKGAHPLHPIIDGVPRGGSLDDKQNIIIRLTHAETMFVVPLSNDRKLVYLNNLKPVLMWPFWIKIKVLGALFSLLTLPPEKRVNENIHSKQFYLYRLAWLCITPGGLV